MTAYAIGTADNPSSVLASHIPDGKYSVDTAAARAITAALDSQRAYVSHLVAQAIPAVMREYPAFAAARQSDSAAYARHCVVMALLSPNLSFNHNLELAQNVLAAFGSLQTLADVRDVLYITTKAGERARFNGWVGKADVLFRALPYLRSITSAADVSRESLLALHGIGPKVCAFALHLLDWSAPAFTLDVHMLRLFCQLAGLPIAANMSITPAAYRLLESALVDYCGAAFPQWPLFAVQWALWDCVRGYHQDHASLFG